jgi:aspartyl protease family protein
MVKLGTFLHPLEIAPLSAQHWEPLEALVDTGATWTWIPRPILDRLGVAPIGRRSLQLANGQIIDRDLGLVLVRLSGQTVATTCIFGDPGSIALLGAVTLEESALAPDPVHKRLVPITGWLASL